MRRARAIAQRPAPAQNGVPLDCRGGAPFVLGRLSARQIAPVTTGEPHVVVGWRLAKDSRKLIVGSGLATAIGQPAGVARHLDLSREILPEDCSGLIQGWFIHRYERQRR